MGIRDYRHFRFQLLPVLPWFITCVIVWLVFLAQSDLDLSNNFSDYNVILTDRSDGKSYKNKTQVVINWNDPLWQLRRGSPLP